VLASPLPVLRGGLAAHPVLRGGRSVLTCLLLSFVIIVAVPLQYASPPSAVSYLSDLATMTRAARYTVLVPAGLVPAGLPPAWSPVSSDVALGGANGAGTVTWHLGYVTSSGTLASVEQSDAAAASFIRRMTNAGPAATPVRVAGRTWRASVNAGRDQRSLYETGPAGATIVITGNASWAQLRVLAASLRPVTPVGWRRQGMSEAGAQS
jgi:Protein of unknown function (DUF4245)